MYCIPKTILVLHIILKIKNILLPHIIALTVFKNMINILISTLPEHFSQNNKNNTAQLLNIKTRPITVVYKFVLKLFWQTGDEILNYVYLEIRLPTLFGNLEMGLNGMTSLLHE